MQGRLIVLEGVEGCGKTTQLQSLGDWLLQSHWLPEILQIDAPQVIQTREPGGTGLGTQLRQLLLQHNDLEPICDRTELLLYAADRAQHVEGFLKPHLAQGAILLCDRYTDSTVAYQGYGRCLDLALIQQLNQIATQGLTSDLTLWLDLDVELGLARTQRRGTTDRIEQAALAFHQRVQQGYAALALAQPERIVRVDASLEAEEVAQQIRAIVAQRFRQWYPQPFQIS